MSEKVLSAKAEARIEAQRERILAAAQECFIDHGFHGASMASIAETAGMSAGLIYRYFENKNAIILAIVERQLELLRNDIQLNRRVDLPAELIHNYGRSCVHDGRGMNAALLLEMSAEATRDPQIAAALDHFDATLRGALQDWLSRSREAGGHGLPAELVPARALMLQCLVEGLKVRETREPGLDRALLSAALHEFVPLLLKP
jgi:AcrR family transcriptional regulator